MQWPTPRYCSTCGALLPEGAVLCGECGARYQDSAAAVRGAERPAAWSPAPVRRSDASAPQAGDGEETGIELLGASSPVPAVPPPSTTGGSSGSVPADGPLSVPEDGVVGGELRRGRPLGDAGEDGDGPRPEDLSAALRRTVPAGLGRRTLAALLDGALAVLASVPLGIGLGLLLAQRSPTLGLILVGIGSVLPVVLLLLMSWMLGTRAATPGHRALRLRVVRAVDGAALGVGRAFLRLLLKGVLGVLAGLSTLIDPRRLHRGWHDLAVGSYVADLRKGEDPTNPVDDYERPPAEHFLPAPQVEISAHDNLMAQPGSPWTQGPRPDATTSRPPQPEHLAWRPETAQTAVEPVPVPSPVAPVPEPEPLPVPSPDAPVPEPEPVPVPSPVAPVPEPEPLPSAPRSPSPRPVHGRRADRGAREAAPPIATEETRLRMLDPADEEDTESTRLAAPATTPRLRLRFDDGAEITISAAHVVVGRNPRTDPEEVPFVLQDSTRSVSKTHLRVSRDGEGLVVTDLGSTNGSEVLTAEGEREPLAAGESRPIGAFADLAMGDRTLHVELVP
ncbi:RDD family protein [Brachybacterium sp. EF45031]|uniref:RDD family protein n=1 Tax=Brachybacterium sillae TaxID=2810536 RepID=UPI0025598C72|nr:RDD family protein [Brachybacterium sillae]MCS6711092.1 RDD family protein [Brachybacterium sillae]